MQEIFVTYMYISNFVMLYRSVRQKIESNKVYYTEIINVTIY